MSAASRDRDRGGRPRLAPGAKRECVVALRVTKLEERLLLELSEIRGCTPSELLRQVLERVLSEHPSRR